MKAAHNGGTIADSDETIVVDRNHYFPPGSFHGNRLEPTHARSVCPWQPGGLYTVKARGRTEPKAAWSYPQPFPCVRQIRGDVASCGDVEIRP